MFDINEEVLKPLELGYLRESVARLDEILEAVIVAKLREKYRSNECQELIILISKLRYRQVLIELAYKKGIITKTMKKKIEEFKAFRNYILHDSIGEITIFNKMKAKDINTFIENEIDKSIKLIKDIIKRV